MLKIKDNLDLKELEKFEFRYDSFGFYFIKKELPFGCQKIIIDEDRTISIIGAGEGTLDNLFDLIKADMVEKVVEE